MYWGFTGKSRGIIVSIIKILHVSRKAFYLILDVLGTLGIGVGGAWLTSKGIEYYSWYSDFSLEGIKALIKSPISLIILGVIFYSIAKYFQWHDNNQLLSQNNELINNNKVLESQMRKGTEDKGILSKRLELAYRELVITWLSTSMHNLEILTPHIRATVYYFKDGAFHYVSRYSKNPMIAQVSTNKVILNGGVLSQAWRTGSYEDLENCPIYSDDEQSYFRYQSQKYSFDENKVRQLTMKPCQYYAKTITESFVPIGIIIFECDIRFLDTAKVNNIGRHCTEHESNLIGYIKKVRDQDASTTPQPIANIEADFLQGLDN